GRLIITTFLFLTMQGTPEAQRLARKLKLRRMDIEYQRLDELETFLNTDLRNDPLLAELFEECGCGHLLRLNAAQPPSEEGYARELRKYLRLDQHSPSSQATAPERAEQLTEVRAMAA